MLTAVEGVFRNGRVELRETPTNIKEARVVVTFLEPATKATEVAEPAVAEGPSPAATPEPTTIQANSTPTAWEHLQKEDFLEEKKSDLEGTHVPIAAAATPDERLRAFRALLASLPEAPAVPLAAMDRENLYP
ncbi:hypothetical protein [Sorangium sp. So ce131]|uniref:hypothetical protein n=1 Tax=Sorangium sp. So ce131 TaxID=3133282 RepID=UPI003F5DC616